MAVEHTFIVKDGYRTRKLTGMSAIRQKCLECQGWHQSYVAKCPSTDCVLHPFRFGKYPKNPNGE